MVVETRISDFKVEPTRVVVGEAIAISGRLEWHQWPFCLWYPLGDKEVEILADSRVVARAKSDADGVFRATWRPYKAGIYWIKARFPGDWWYNPCQSKTIRIEVITPEQKREEELRFWAMVGVGAVAAAGIAAAVIYHFETERQLEILAGRL